MCVGNGGKEEMMQHAANSVNNIASGGSEDWTVAEIAVKNIPTLKWRRKS